MLVRARASQTPGCACSAAPSDALWARSLDVVALLLLRRRRCRSEEEVPEEEEAHDAGDDVQRGAVSARAVDDRAREAGAGVREAIGEGIEGFGLGVRESAVD